MSEVYSVAWEDLVTRLYANFKRCYNKNKIERFGIDVFGF